MCIKYTLYNAYSFLSSHTFHTLGTHKHSPNNKLLRNIALYAENSKCYKPFSRAKHSVFFLSISILFTYIKIFWSSLSLLNFCLELFLNGFTLIH